MPRGKDQLNIDLRPGQKERLDILLSHGTKSPVLRTMVDLLCDLLEQENGDLYLGALMTGNLTIDKIVLLNSGKFEHKE